jgi:hypothetical protein
MNNEDFIQLVLERQEQCLSILSYKRKEYSPGRDRMSNFKRAGDMLGTAPESALIGFVAKTWTSLLDMVDELNSEKCPLQVRPIEVWTEKITDVINYLHLLEGLIVEREMNSKRNLPGV